MILKYEFKDGHFKVKQSYVERKNEEIRLARERSRAVYNNEVPPDMGSTKVNPINFTIFSPRQEQSKPGWKKGNQMGRKYKAEDHL